MGIIRKTKGVTLVLNIFEKTNDALSVVRLIELLKNDLNKTSVYRILERLEKEGVIHSFNAKDGLKWYAKCKECSSHCHSDKHPHFQCTECEKVECLTLEVKIPNNTNHKIDNTEILLVGQCETCSV